MAWYLQFIIIIILVLFGLIIFALVSINKPFREDSDKAQMEWLKKFREQEKKE